MGDPNIANLNSRILIQGPQTEVPLIFGNSRTQSPKVAFTASEEAAIDEFLQAGVCQKALKINTVDGQNPA